MLWIPLNPVAGGQPGNERGNPHVDVKEVLAIWRESASPELRKTWLVVDPALEDRVTDVAGLAQFLPAPPPEPAVPLAANESDMVASASENEGGGCPEN